MRIIVPLPIDNPRGANPEDSIYIAINKLYPEFGLTQANSKIIATQPAVTEIYPHMKRILVQKGDDLNEQYAFFYNCHSVPLVFSSIFTPEQIEIASKLKTSAELISWIGEANSLNMRPEDWWCSTTSITYTGGTKGPNFLLKAKYNAQWYIGEIVTPLWV